MNFLQKVGNYIARFMYGRNGADQLGLTIVWTSILLNVLGIFIHAGLVGSVVSTVSTALLIWAIFRLFSRNLEKRRAENARFLEKVWYPITRGAESRKRQMQDREHKYFTCPNCRTVCRVPRGKGKIVITCPKCGGEIHGKS